MFYVSVSEAVIRQLYCGLSRTHVRDRAALSASGHYFFGLFRLIRLPSHYGQIY
jgi:hypothetical protein